MPNILPPVAKRHNSHRRVLDPCQHWLKGGIQIAQQSARHIRRRGQHQTLRDCDLTAARLAKPYFESDRFSLGPSHDSAHLRTEAQPGANSLSKRAHQCLVATTKVK